MLVIWNPRQHSCRLQGIQSTLWSVSTFHIPLPLSKLFSYSDVH